MNANRIINLPDPVDPLDAVRLKDVLDYLVATQAAAAEALDSADDSAISAGEAAQSATDSATSEGISEDWSLLAQRWAEHPEFAEVIDGEEGNYSAFHWAQIAITAGGTGLSVDIEPPFKANGSREAWYSLNDGQLYVDIDDGDSFQWVVANAPLLSGMIHHPDYLGDDIDIDTGVLTGATVISDLDFNVTTDTKGHVSDANGAMATRELTPANIGAATAGHTHAGVYAEDVHFHAAVDTISGTFNIARIPTGTTGTTVALGNHTHGGSLSLASSGSNSNGYYRVYSDGYREMWGETSTINSSGSPKVLSFPTPFTNAASIEVQLTCHRTRVWSYGNELYARNETTTNCIIECSGHDGGPQSREVFWRASGY
jgi:hypothetical protein